MQPEDTTTEADRAATNKDAPPKSATSPRRVTRWAVTRSVAGAVIAVVLLFGSLGFFLALFHPESPLPREWNPTQPLAVTDPVTPLTMWKLRRALGAPALCRAALATGAGVTAMAPLQAGNNCSVRNRVTLSSVGPAAVDPVETACATALRLAMWQTHGVQNAAQEFLGTEVSVIRQVGSYNCRRIRSTRGSGGRWSTHATAEAIDITGFDLADGRRIRLDAHWGDGSTRGEFLRVVRDSACTWFATTLGPEYNALHADHFHLQSRGWGLCR